MPKTSKQEVDELIDLLTRTPTTKNNPAVQSSIEEVEEAVNKDPNYFNPVNNLVSSLTAAVAAFAKEDANTADITSGILYISSGLVGVIGTITGFSIITGPVSIVMRLAGSILGAFGASKTSRYAAALQSMIDEAANKANSQQVDQTLQGALEQMQVQHIFLAGILAKTYTTPGDLLIANPTIDPKYYVDIAETQLGAAYQNLLFNTDKSNATNGANAAETFYLTSKVVAFKILLFLEALTYFQLAETNSKLSVSRADELVDSFTAFVSLSYKHAEPYFVKPTIVFSVITHWIYRFSPERFRFVVSLYQQLSTDVPFWPTNAKQGPFTCTKTDKHKNPTPGMKCYRMVTLNASENSNAVLIVDHGPDGSGAARLNFANSKDANSHFVLSNTDGNQPSQRWQLSMHDKAYGSVESHPAEIDYTSGLFYIFQVYATRDELENKDKLWGRNIKNQNKNDQRTLFAMGSAGGDLVWCNDSTVFQERSFNDIVYKSGSAPDRMLWYLFNENEL